MCVLDGDKEKPKKVHTWSKANEYLPTPKAALKDFFCNEQNRNLGDVTDCMSSQPTRTSLLETLTSSYLI